MVGLEDHVRAHLEVLVQVQPRAVRAWLVVEAVCQDPALLVRVECDAGLTLRKQLVVDPDVTVGSPSDHDRLSSELLFVVVDLTSRGSSEDLKLELD